MSGVPEERRETVFSLTEEEARQFFLVMCMSHGIVGGIGTALGAGLQGFSVFFSVPGAIVGFVVAILVLGFRRLL